MIGSASKHLDRDDGLLELTVVALQMPLGDEPQEAAHPLVPKKTGACQHSFQLAAGGIDIAAHEGHVFENTSCFQRCANV